jgi:hypothetical protein
MVNEWLQTPRKRQKLPGSFCRQAEAAPPAANVITPSSLCFYSSFGFGMVSAR